MHVVEVKAYFLASISLGDVDKIQPAFAWLCDHCLKEESFSLENARNGIILDHVNMVEIVTKKLNSKIKTLMKELHQKDARIKELEATLHQKQTDVCSGCDIDFWWDSDEKTEEKVHPLHQMVSH